MRWKECACVCWAGENKSCTTMAVTTRVPDGTGVATGQTRITNTQTTTIANTSQTQIHFVIARSYMIHHWGWIND